MQGTWKETVSGWKKDSRRKKTSRKYTEKEKYNAIVNRYHDTERGGRFFHTNVFRIENDDLFVDYTCNKKKTVEKKMWYKIRYYATVSLTLRKTDSSNFKILDSIEELDKSNIEPKTTTISLYGDCASWQYENKDKRGKYYGWPGNFDEYFDLKTGENISSKLRKEYDEKKYRIDISVGFINKKSQLEGFEEFLSKTKKTTKDRTLSQWWYGSFYSYDSTRYLYNKPIQYHHRLNKKRRSNLSTFGKKCVSSKIRMSEKNCCKKAMDTLDLENFTVNIATKKSKTWWY